MTMRTRAVFCALCFGLLPWWVYEPTCHYAGESYGAHLLRNLRLAWLWLTGRQRFGDVRFEVETNRPMPRLVRLRPWNEQRECVS